MGRGGSFRGGGGGGGGKSSGSSKSSVYVSPGSNIKAAAAASRSRGFTGGSGQSHVEEDVSPTKDCDGKCYSYLRAYNHCIKYEDPMCWLWENNYKDHCGGIAPIVDPKLAEPTSEYDRGGSVWCEWLQRWYNKCVAEEGRENCWFSEEQGLKKCGKWGFKADTSK